MMKAAFVTKYGGPEVLEIRETPIPEPAEDQILIKVRAIGLNFADVMGRFGVYPGTPKPPFILGLEFSGDVVEIGAGVTSFKGGERVMGYSRHGSHAEYVCVNALRQHHGPLLLLSSFRVDMHAQDPSQRRPRWVYNPEGDAGPTAERFGLALTDRCEDMRTRRGRLYLCEVERKLP